MKVVELRDLAEGNPRALHKELTAVAVINGIPRQSESDISITLEHGPLGPPDVRDALLDAVELPDLARNTRDQGLCRRIERSGRLP